MTEKKAEKTVTLIAPNGLTVSVAESKKAERIAAGYRVPEAEKKPAAKGRTASSKED